MSRTRSVLHLVAPSAIASFVLALASAALGASPSPRPALFASQDQGLTWTPVASDLPRDLDVSFLELWGDRLVIGAEQGLFAGNPRTGIWHPLHAGLPASKITALHLAGETLYAGVAARGLFASRDSGRTWRSLNEGLPDLRVRAALEIEGDRLVATDTGLFRQRARGRAWRRVFGPGQFVTLVRSGRHIVAGGARGTARSEDGGRRWKWIHREGAAHNTALIGGSIVLMNISGDLHRSDDAGRTWRAITYAPRAGSYVYEMAGTGPRWIASNNYGIHASADGGDTWRLVHPTEEMVFIDFATVDGVLYAGTRAWKERRGRSR